MLRKIRLACAAILAREGQRLLQDLNAPDFGTLLRRVTFWVRFYIGLSIILGGVVAVEEVFGLAPMFVALMVVYLVLLSRQNGGGGISADDAAFLLGDQALPPPSGNPQLPPSSTPQVGKASTALTPSRPGPVARR
jgi:hypothetical protein